LLLVCLIAVTAALADGTLPTRLCAWLLLVKSPAAPSQLQLDPFRRAHAPVELRARVPHPACARTAPSLPVLADRDCPAPCCARPGRRRRVFRCLRAIAQLAQVALGCAQCSCRCCAVANDVELALLLASPFVGRGCLSLWSRVCLSRAREFEALHVHRPLVPVRPIRALAFCPSGFARAHVCCRVVYSRYPLLNPTSSARSRHNPVIIPCIVMKSQASGEDEASSMVFTKCSNKSSSVILVYAKPPSREDPLVLATPHQLDKINPMGI
jgi:hypothetical protein